MNNELLPYSENILAKWRVVDASCWISYDIFLRKRSEVAQIKIN